MWRGREAHKEELHVKIKAEIGAMQLQPKEGLQDCWESPETRRGKEGSFPRVFRGSILGIHESELWANKVLLF